jgi:hypothetical protein
MLLFDPNSRIKWNSIYDHDLFKEKAGMGGKKKCPLFLDLN